MLIFRVCLCLSPVQKELSWHTAKTERSVKRRQLLSSYESLGPVRIVLGWHRFMRGWSPGIEKERGYFPGFVREHHRRPFLPVAVPSVVAFLVSIILLT